MKWDRNTSIRLTSKLRSGNRLSGLGFENCRIEGPAILCPHGDGIEFSNCEFFIEGGRSRLVAKKTGLGEPPPAGVIFISNIRFIRCTIVDISFAGDEKFLNSLYRGTSDGPDFLKS